MATVDHLDAPYVRTPPKTENLLAHSRNLSTISNVTLFTTTTNHSHPTEPLLPATIPQTVNYDDQIPTMERPPCEIPLMMHDNPVNEGEEKGYWARDCRRPLKRWKWLKLGLQAVLCEFPPNIRRCPSRSSFALVFFWLTCYFYSCLGHLQHGSIPYCILRFWGLYKPDFLSGAWNQYRRFLFIDFFLLLPCHQW